MHVPRIFVFRSSWENYMLLSVVIFWEMGVHILYEGQLSSSLLSQVLSVEPLILLNISMDIADVYVSSIFIFLYTV
jgi:hypothetical protein